MGGEPRRLEPARYDARGAGVPHAEFVAAYVAWCCEVPDGKVRRRNTDESWVAKKKRHLAELAEQLHGRNLRNDGSAGCVTTDDLRDLLAGRPK